MVQELLYWQALNRALDQEMAANDAVLVLGEDVGLYGGTYRVTEGLYAKYGEWRVRDTPISENSYTGLGIGAAMAGGRPVVEIMTVNFLPLAMDAVVNLAAKIMLMSARQFRIPIVIRMPGGIAKQLGAQHSQRLETMLMNVPGLRIAVPATPQDAYWQLRQAINLDDPVIVLEHEVLYFTRGPVDDALEPPPLDAAVIRRKGADVTLIAYSRMVLLAIEAADTLQAEGINAEVIDLRSLKPIDWETCTASIQNTHRAVIIEEDCRFAGAGAEIAATLTEACFFYLDSPIERIAGLDLPTPFNAELEASAIPTTAQIVETVHRVTSTVVPA